MKKILVLAMVSLLIFFPTISRSQSVKPITGSFINLTYQDVRNKYMNPQYFDNTDPQMWRAKVRELHAMGMEYLVFLAVANDEKSFYPSKLMPWAYPKEKQSPVDAIMDEAARLNMKVFMSIGWAKDQDDDIRDAKIRNRQLAMMKELVTLYGKHKALYGWYLPVEDCICPVFAEHAVQAVNELTKEARSLTPGKKILISPYGLSQSDFNRADYEQQLAKLKVDIIAYQDEVGCVREPFPIVNLKKNWKKLRDIHNRLHIELWANVESFTWEKAPNDRTSALIPAAFPRLLSQMAAASEAPVDRIISFSVCGIIDDPRSSYQLGQPVWSHQVYNEYMAWKAGSEYTSLMESSFTKKLNNSAGSHMIEESQKALLDGVTAEENAADAAWVKFGKGYHEVLIDMEKNTTVRKILLRMLNDHEGNIGLPLKVYLFASSDAKNYHLISIKDTPVFPNNNLDVWIDTICFDLSDINTRYLKVAFDAPQAVYMDEIYVNPIKKN